MNPFDEYIESKSSDRWRFIGTHYWYRRKDWFRCTGCGEVSAKDRYAVLNGNPKCVFCRADKIREGLS